MVIAIDGTTASGKGTVARLLAEKLNISYLDTGAIYRSLAVFFIKRGYSLDNFGTAERAEFANSLAAANVRLEDSALEGGTGKGETGEDGMLKNGVLKDSALKNSALEDGTAKNSTLKNSALKSGTGRKLRVFLNGDDITDIIRDNRVSVIVPVLAQFDFVQDKVHKIQHEYAGKNSLVVEGRETTSVAFPNADYKFYFDAEINLRARRRLADLQRKGENVPFETVLSQIKERDRLDFERELSPLIKVPDAIEIDGTGKTPNEMLDEILVYIKK